MKFRASQSNKYFIIEHLPSEGMGVYHCDINGSNEWQDGTASRHYQIALLQAVGRFDQELNGPSDNTDLFGARALKLFSLRYGVKYFSLLVMQ